MHVDGNIIRVEFLSSQAPYPLMLQSSTSSLISVLFSTISAMAIVLHCLLYRVMSQVRVLSAVFLQSPATSSACETVLSVEEKTQLPSFTSSVSNTFTFIDDLSSCTYRMM